MQNNQLKGIYLHGYQGYVTEEKKAFLESYGEVYAPAIDYDQQPKILYQLYEAYKDKELDFVSGTSLGGLLIYHLALLLDKPCLLLNPAVTALEQVKPFIPNEAYRLKPKSKVMVLVGMKDDIVSPEAQLEFFTDAEMDSNLIFIEKDEDLAHFVSLERFEQSFNSFRNYIK